MNAHRFFCVVLTAIATFCVPPIGPARNAAARLDASEPYQMRFNDPLVQPWRISRFMELEGRGLRCLAEDQQGNMWFGIRGGALKYDGLQWHEHGIESGLDATSVDSIAACDDGTIVAATDVGLFRFSGQRWQRFFPADGTKETVRISFVMEASDGALWACSAWGLLRIVGDQTTLFTSSDYGELVDRCGDVFDVVQDLPARSMPFVPHFKGTGIALVERTVACFSEDSAAEAAGLRVGDSIVKVQVKSTNLSASLQRDAGEPLVAEVKRFDTGETETIEFTTAETSQRFRSPEMHSVMEDSQGRIWAGARHGRIMMTTDQGSTWQMWNRSDGPTLGNRPAAIETSNGEIWVVSTQKRDADRKHSVCRFDGTSWTSERLGMLTGVNYVAAAAETVDGRVWISGLNRLHVWNRDHWKSHDTRTSGIPSESHRMLVASDDALWIAGFGQYAVRIEMSLDKVASYEGVDYQCTDENGARWFIEDETKRIIRDDGVQAVSFGTEDDVISRPRGITAVEGGVVAVGSHEQIACVCTFDGETWTRVEFPGVAREFSAKGYTVTRDGRVWIAAIGNRQFQQIGGVIAGFGDQWEHFKPPSAPAYATSIMELPDGQMMFGGGYGAVLYDGESWSPVENELLVETSCPDGLATKDGTLWLATRSRGVLRLQDGKWSAFSTREGLPANDVSSIVADSDGMIWASTTAGLSRFDGERFYPVNLPNYFGRRSMRSDSDGAIWFDGEHRYALDKESPTARISEKSIRVDQSSRVLLSWHGVDAWNRTPADALSWSFQLDGGPWSRYTRERQLVLENLPGGEHTVRVKSRDSDFNESSVSDTAAIVVMPPIWVRPWFVATSALMLAALAWLSLGLIRRGMELRKSNRELEEARSRLAAQFADKSAQFRAVCDASPIGIFVTDTTGNTTYINPYLAKLLGMSPQDGNGFGWTDALHRDDRERFVESWTRSLNGNEPFRDSGRFVHTNGRVVWFNAVADRIERGGKLIGYVGAVENITEQLAASQALTESNEKLQSTLEQLESAQDKAIKRERLSALGQMAAGVAHDINNALAPLLTYAELLAEDAQIQGTNRERIEMIRLGVSDTAGIVRRLEHFYRESHNRDFLESVDMADVVEQAIEMTRPRWQNIAQREGKHIEVQTEFDARPIIDGHPAQIRAVLTNLLFNAVDAITDQGTVTVRLRQTPIHAILEVEDDGDGMNAEQLDHCLEPFYTSKAKGSGLGLSECHGVVRQHGGTIDIHSRVDRGTRVRVSMPLAHADGDGIDLSVENRSNVAAERIPSSPMPLATVNRDTRVLYIDDDETVRRSTVALLSACQIAVDTAPDGPSGLAQLERSDYQLVICDQGLPGMDGVAVLQEIKQRYPDLPVVMVSGWSIADIRSGIQPDDFLEKPVALDKLLTVLQRHLPQISVA